MAKVSGLIFFPQTSWKPCCKVLLLHLLNLCHSCRLSVTSLCLSVDEISENLLTHSSPKGLIFPVLLHLPALCLSEWNHMIEWSGLLAPHIFSKLNCVLISSLSFPPWREGGVRAAHDVNASCVQNERVDTEARGLEARGGGCICLRIWSLRAVTAAWRLLYSRTLWSVQVAEQAQSRRLWCKLTDKRSILN